MDLIPYEEVTELMNSGLTNKQIASKMNEKYPGMFNSRHKMIMSARNQYLTDYKVPDKEIYYKDSLMTYDKIQEDVEDLEDLGQALKIKMTALKDRNELLGLSKSSVNVSINFEQSGYSDEEYLKDRNVEVIDVEKES